MAVSKILVLNPSPSSLDAVFQKANVQNERNGPFESVLLLGDVIPVESQEMPSTSLAMPTFFTRGIKEVSDVVANDHKTNLNYKSGLLNVLTLDSGITVVFVSGVLESADAETKSKELAQMPPADILVTYNWPQAIAHQEKLTLVANPFVDEIVKKIMPRYHFCVGVENGRYFESKPFKWSNGTLTRFISLGQEGSGSKWFYAFNISTDPPAPETNTMPNPFTLVQEAPKRKLDTSSESAPASIVKKARVVTPDKCFFCLLNPNVETHMIVSLGKHSYFTTAKGPLPKLGKTMKFSGHAIIIPIQHLPTLGSEQAEVRDEIVKYEEALVKAFAQQQPSYRIVSFEVNRSLNVHFHVQILPIPETAIGTFEDILYERAHHNNEHFTHNQALHFKKFAKDDDPELVDIIKSNKEYIKFQLFSTDAQKTTYIAVLENAAQPVDLQFPRRVLASTLHLPKRIQWERCKESKTRETRECQEFKSFFKDFDFS